jgi:hypothetical protein
MKKEVSDPRYTGIIVDCLYEILGRRLGYRADLDIYGADLVDDEDVGFLVEGITRRVGREVEEAGGAYNLVGLLEMISH